MDISQNSSGMIMKLFSLLSTRLKFEVRQRRAGLKDEGEGEMMIKGHVNNGHGKWCCFLLLTRLPEDCRRGLHIHIQRSDEEKTEA